jgi:hypothetical protein
MRSRRFKIGALLASGNSEQPTRMRSDDRNQNQCALPATDLSAEHSRMKPHRPVERQALPMTWAEWFDLVTKGLERIGTFLLRAAALGAWLHSLGVPLVPF